MPQSKELREAARESVPLLLALGPFGMVFGALAADAGLSLLETFGFSAGIYAGASQLVALQFLALGAPLWSILVAVVALNFRHVLYSASISRHLQRFTAAQKAVALFFLVDPLFASAERRAGIRAISRSYYFCFALILYAGWMSATVVGHVFGGLIGDQRAFGLDILLPVFFLAQAMGFCRRPNFLPVFATSAIVSVVVYATLGAPWHVTLGGLSGVALAALRKPSTGSARPAATGDEREALP